MNYEQVTILTDGAIVFEENFNYIRSEESIILNKCLAAYCADLMIYPAQGDGIWYSGDDNSATFRWKTSKYDEPDVDIEMAIKIYSWGRIEFYYGNDITEGLNWGSGISNGDGSSYTISQMSNAYSIPDDYETQFICPGFPNGMQISENGLFYGTPEVWTYTDIDFLVTDYSNITSMKSLLFYACLAGIETNISGNSRLNLLVNPNPVSDKASIVFTLSKEEKVNLSIYNLNGQLINTILYQKALGAGDYNFDWSGTNDRGTRVKSGLYYCVISTLNYTESVKFILLK